MTGEKRQKLGKETLTVLDPIIEATRSELRDRDIDDIPSALRKVARSSAKRLPPPIANSVVTYLVRDGDLRVSVKQRMMEEGSINETLLRFLENPDDGLALITHDVASTSAEQVREELERSTRRVANLERQLKKAKSRMVDERGAHVEELDRFRQSEAGKHRRTVDRNSQLRSQIQNLESSIADFEARVSNLEEAVAAGEEQLRTSAAKLARKKLMPSTSTRRAAAESGLSPSDPLELARLLDRIDRTNRPYRSASGGFVLVSQVAALSIPLGISPDSPAALGALIEQVPARIIIDGYNVSGEMHGREFSTRESRDVVVHQAERLRRRTSAEVILVFDGPDTSELSGFRSGGGVSVLFSTGEEADDVIEALVLEEPERTVVVTNDALLRQRCSVEGCVPIWSTALISYLNSSSTSR